MNFQQIVQELAAIKQLCEGLDLTQTGEVKDIRKQGEAPIRKAENLTRDKNFEESSLEDLIASFEKANTNAKKYDAKDDEKKVTSFINQHKYTEASKVQDVIDAKKGVQEDIGKKYQELTRKQAVIKAYVEQYNPNELTSREERKIVRNDQKREYNEQLIDDIESFINNEIKGNLESIEEYAATVEILDEIRQLLDERERFKRDKVANPKFATQIEKNIQDLDGKIQGKCEEVNTKSGGKISLNPKATTLKTDVDSEKRSLKGKIVNEGTEISKKIKGIQREDYKTKNLREVLSKRVSASTEPTKIAEELKKIINEKVVENLNLGTKSDRARANIETMNLAQAQTKPGTQPIEVSEEEIEEALQNDPSMSLILPQTKKEYQNAYYEKYLKDKGKKKDGLHPIAFLVSRFGKESRQGWKKQQEDIAEKREEIKKDIEGRKVREQYEAARKYNDARRDFAHRKDSFKASIFHKVMGVDNDTLKQYEESAQKGEYGELTSEGYDAAEKDR